MASTHLLLVLFVVIFLSFCQNIVILSKYCHFVFFFLFFSRWYFLVTNGKYSPRAGTFCRFFVFLSKYYHFVFFFLLLVLFSTKWQVLTSCWYFFSFCQNIVILSLMSKYCHCLFFSPAGTFLQQMASTHVLVVFVFFFLSFCQNIVILSYCQNIVILSFFFSLLLVLFSTNWQVLTSCWYFLSTAILLVCRVLTAFLAPSMQRRSTCSLWTSSSTRTATGVSRL